MIKEQLKKLAREFLQAELWEDLTDADVFGVELEDGRIAYCCVMGNSGSRPSCRDQEGRKGSEEGVPENLSVPLEGNARRSACARVADGSKYFALGIEEASMQKSSFT